MRAGLNRHVDRFHSNTLDKIYDPNCLYVYDKQSTYWFLSHEFAFRAIIVYPHVGSNEEVFQC